MQFNYAKERKNFEENWKRMKVEYRKAGMSDSDIQIMYEYDLTEFRQRRIYCLHNESREELEEKQNQVYIESIRVENAVEKSIGRKGWIEELDNQKLYAAVRELKEEDVELLTLWAIEKYTVTEIARMKKVSQPTVSKKVARIKNFLKKSCERAMD